MGGCVRQASSTRSLRRRSPHVNRWSPRIVTAVTQQEHRRLARMQARWKRVVEYLRWVQVTACQSDKYPLQNARVPDHQPSRHPKPPKPQNPGPKNPQTPGKKSIKPWTLDNLSITQPEHRRERTALLAPRIWALNRRSSIHTNHSYSVLSALVMPTVMRVPQ